MFDTSPKRTSGPSVSPWFNFRITRDSEEINMVEGWARWIAERWRDLDAARHCILRAFAVLLGAFACFDDFVTFLGADLDARRFLGTFPILGSPARMRSQACSAASSKSCASAPNTWMDRMLGNSRCRLRCWSSVVASHTPLSAA
jgi:hypothetical protein